ncbi:MAG: hypothetical protein JSV24_08585 [Bacteroidales bacterium]|nr:MAG: hypothetical protein JSV24_08585 [Bacteroidales bacterium]
MKKITFGLLISFILFSCGTTTQQENNEGELQLTEVSLTDLLEHPDNYVDKNILVGGIVDHVCRQTGKKMFIVDQNADNRLRINVGKDIASFDVELEGNDVLIEGIFQELVVDEDYLSKWEAELGSQEEPSETEHAQTELGEMADQGEHVGDMEQIQSLREQLETSGKEQISFYSVECMKFSKKESTE